MVIHSKSIAAALCAALLAAGCSGGGGSSGGGGGGGGTTTYTISGAVSGATSVTVTLSTTGAADRTTTTGTGGAYAFTGVANGTYTVTPSKATYTMSPLSTAVTVAGADKTGVNFTATVAGGATYGITGTVTKSWGGALSGATVTLSQGATTLGTALTTASGGYSFSGVANGSYVVTPTLAGYVFSPSAPTVVVNSADATQNFTADGANTISGTVSTAWGSKLQSVSVALSGGGVTKPAAVTDANGAYTISGVPNGSFTVTPTLSGYVFTPSAPTLTVSGNQVQDFAADGAWAISGTVSGAGVSGVSIALSGGGVVKTPATSASDGTYTIAGIPNGTYTLTATHPGYSLSPTTPTVVVNGGSAQQDFTSAVGPTYAIGGTLTGAGSLPLAGMTVRLSGSSTGIAYTDASGNYSFSGLASGGTYTVAPATFGYTFAPAPLTYASLAANVADANFSTSQSAPVTYSGTLSYAGAKSGPVYVTVTSSGGGGGPASGTGLTSQAGSWSGRAFTMRNVVTNGTPTYSVTAWMDTLGIGHFNAAADPSVTFSGSGATLGDHALLDPVGIPSVGPGDGLRIDEIVAFDQGAVVAFTAPRDANGHEAADSYRVYWNTSATVDSTHNLGSLVVPAGGTLAIVKGLTNGTAYWFRMVAYVGSNPLINQSVATTSSAVVGSSTGSATVTGTVTYPSLSAPCALYVVAGLAGSGGKHYVQRIANPSGTSSGYSLQVPPGAYQIFALVDLGDDGVVLPGEPMPETQAWTGTINLAAGANAGPTVGISAGKSIAAIYTNRWAGQGYTGTSLQLDSYSNLSPSQVLPLTTSITGPGLPGGLADLAADAWGGGGGLHVSGWVSTDPVDPVVGDAYAVTVTYTDGTSDAFSPSVTGLFGSAPAIVAPAANATGVSTTPTFQWSAPATPPGTYGYQLQVGGNQNAWSTLLPSGTTQVAYDADGTALTPQLGAFANDTWQLTAMDTHGNVAATYASFTTGAAQLATYDPLSAPTVNGALWQTPQFSRTVTGGQGVLAAQADGMEGRLDQGALYMNNLAVATGGHRVTTFQSDITVPSASAQRGGTDTATIQTGVRLNYQPAANRLYLVPGQYLNLLAFGLELFDSGSGPKIRARAYHCDNGACSAFSDSGFVWSTAPAPFVQEPTGAVADGAYDVTYTFKVSVDESTDVASWTVSGGAFGTGVSGSVNLSTWVNGVGMVLGSSANGFYNAQLLARAFDESVAGGGYAAVTAEYDNVFVGFDGGTANLWDDFATMGSNATNGFAAAKWGGANGSALESGGALHLRSAHTTPATFGGGETTSFAAMFPATFNSWQADVTIVADSPAAGSTDYFQMGGTFAYDGSAGSGPNSPLGAVVANVQLESGTATYWVGRCTAVTNAGCSNYTTLGSGSVPVGSVALAVGSVHTLFEQWDPVAATFTFRLDDGTPVQVVPSIMRALPPWAPTRYLQAAVSIPSGAPAGTSASVEAAVGNVQYAP